MTIYNLYIFDRHCQCIYFQKWTHNNKTTTSSTTNPGSSNTGTNSQLGNSSSRLGGLTNSRFSTSTSSSTPENSSPNTLLRSGEDSGNLHSQTGVTQQSGLAAGSVISIEEEAKLVYGVILSLRNFVRKLSGT